MLRSGGEAMGVPREAHTYRDCASLLADLTTRRHRLGMQPLDDDRQDFWSMPAGYHSSVTLVCSVSTQ